MATFAVAEARPVFDPRELRTRARQDEQGFVLNGEKTLVALADKAELLLVAADLVGHGPHLFLVDAHAQGVSVKADRGMGLRAASLGSVRFTDVALPAAALLGEAPLARATYEEVLHRSSIAWSRWRWARRKRCSTTSIPYCNDRSAFGEPISHRQGVAFMVADIAIELEGMRLLTWRAASRAEHGLSFPREAYLARAVVRRQGHADRHQRRAAARRPRLHQGASGRALVPRPARHLADGRRRAGVSRFMLR